MRDWGDIVCLRAYIAILRYPMADRRLFRLITSLLCFSCIAFSGCKKKKFKQITETDESGAYIGEVDDTDWQIDLFYEESSIPRAVKEEFDQFNCGLGEFSYWFGDPTIVAYPNPTVDSITIEFFAPDHSLEVVLVGRTNKVFYSECFQITDSILHVGISFDELSVKRGKHYRLYYQLYEDEYLEEHGHGDIYYE